MTLTSDVDYFIRGIAELALANSSECVPQK